MAGASFLSEITPTGSGVIENGIDLIRAVAD